MKYDDYKKGLIILRRTCLVRDKMLTKQLPQCETTFLGLFQVFSPKSTDAERQVLKMDKM